MTSLLKFIKIHKFIRKLIRDRQRSDLTRLIFLFKESRLKADLEEIGYRDVSWI
jgi:hypothetical protein